MNNNRLTNLIHKQAQKYGERVALKYRDYTTNTWIPVSWNEFALKVKQVSNSLLELGVQVQEKLGVFSQNKPECLFTDFAAFNVRAVTIPLYATCSESQVEYIVNDAEIKYIFVGEQYQYDIALKVQQDNKFLKQLIIFDRDVKKKDDDTTSIYYDEFINLGKDFKFQKEVEQRILDSNAEDLANILYTSGTTGESKGVMLQHSCYNIAIDAHCQRFPDFDDTEVIINFLPFTHIFERAWSYWALYVGAQLAVNLYPQDIQKTIKEIRPTAMCSVPRFWEKVYAGVQEKIDESKGLQKWLMLDAIETGRIHNIECLSFGKKPSFFNHLKYKFYEKTIYRLLKKTIGIENGHFFPTAGAAVPPAVHEFTRSVGIRMVTGYGLTESTASVSCDDGEDFRIGSVGKLLPHVELKIGENNEFLIRGGGVVCGYYKKDKENKEAYTEDGWFHTGDAGYVKDGHLYITDRIKDLYKTSNGKYIAPQAIESKLIIDKFIDQISVIADKRKFVSALIVPEYKLVEDYAQKNGIEFKSREDLMQNPKIYDMFMQRIEDIQKVFASYERIKRFTLLPHPFSMEKGELTNTLKVKRNVLVKNYAAEIEKMYEN